MMTDVTDRLTGKRVLVTQADEFMGPATVELFAEAGATLVCDSRDLTEPGACAAAVHAAGQVDVLIANLASPNFSGTPTESLADDHWHCAFDRMVHPLHRLTRALLPQMKERQAGKIVVYGSSTALTGQRMVAAYSAARAAQVGYVQSVGIEAAPYNIQINLIAQNYVENPVYYPPALLAKESFQRSLRRQVPLGRLATAREDALFALFLASEESNFFVGQAIPFAGGSVQR